MKYFECNVIRNVSRLIIRTAYNLENIPILFVWYRYDLYRNPWISCTTNHDLLHNCLLQIFCVSMVQKQLSLISSIFIKFTCFLCCPLRSIRFWEILNDAPKSYEGHSKSSRPHLSSYVTSTAPGCLCRRIVLFVFCSPVSDTYLWVNLFLHSLLGNKTFCFVT